MEILYKPRLRSKYSTPGEQLPLPLPRLLTVVSWEYKIFMTAWQDTIIAAVAVSVSVVLLFIIIFSSVWVFNVRIH